MRTALQPWIDEPIAYPLQATSGAEDSQGGQPGKVATASGTG
jgi:hypothetical protein